MKPSMQTTAFKIYKNKLFTYSIIKYTSKKMKKHVCMNVFFNFFNHTKFPHITYLVF